MIRQRRARIVATLGPASREPGDGAGPGHRRRRRVPAELQPRQPRKPRRRPASAVRHAERRAGPAAGRAGRPAGAEARGSASSRTGPSPSQPGHRLRLDLDTTPGDDKRVGMPHPELFAAMKARRAAAGRRRQGAACRWSRSATASADRRGDPGRAAVRPQGPGPAGRGDPDGRPDAQGPRGPAPSPSASASTGWPCPSCSGPADMAELRKLVRRQAPPAWPRSKSPPPSSIWTPSSTSATG